MQQDAASIEKQLRASLHRMEIDVLDKETSINNLVVKIKEQDAEIKQYRSKVRNCLLFPLLRVFLDTSW